MDSKRFLSSLNVITHFFIFFSRFINRRWNRISCKSKELFKASNWLSVNFFPSLCLAIRSQDDDTRSSPRRAESSPEVDGPSCVYDNDFLGEMSGPPTRAQQHQNRAPAPHAEVRWMWLMKNYAMVHTRAKHLNMHGSDSTDLDALNFTNQIR